MNSELAASIMMAALVGILSGSHAAIWGMYKDSAHEGFSGGAFARSIALGIAGAIAVQLTLNLRLPSASAVVLLFGLSYGIERTITESWKTFIRNEDQSKYFIPMQFSIRGVPVASRAARLGAGLICLAAMAFCLTAIARLGQPAATLAPLSRAALVGGIIGLIIACGGCWKDAPKEGFDPIKFFRSPLITLFYALILSRITSDYLVMAVAAIGYERATAETYKTFFCRSKPPGKFTGKPILHPIMLARRVHFAPAYAAITVTMAGYLTVAVQR